MPGTLPRYRPSGRTSIRFVPAVAGGAALAIGAGWAYQAVTGGGYVFLLLCEYALFAIAVVAAVVIAGRLGHNRNRRRGALAGLAIAAAGLAAAYYFDWRAMAADVAPTPLSFGDFLERRVDAGWTLGRRDPGADGTLTGGLVWLAWTIEALGVLGLGAAFGAGFGPYCERSGHWMEVEPVLRRDGLDATAVGVVARATTIDELLRLPPPPAVPAPPPPTGATYLRLDAVPARDPASERFTLIYKAHRCRHCDADPFVTVTRRGTVIIKRGTYAVRKSRTDTLHAQIAVPRERLRAFAAAAAPASSGSGSPPG